MTPPSLRNRIRNGTLAMLVVALALGALALPEVHQLGGAIRETLYRNYVSIEAAQHMHAALWRLQLALRDGTLSRGSARAAATSSRIGSTSKEHDITEAGEAHWHADIDERGRRLFAEFGRRGPARPRSSTANSPSCISGSTS